VSPRLFGEYLQEPGLAYSPNTIDMGDEGAVFVQYVEECAYFLPSADEGLSSLLFQVIPNTPSHDGTS
jgi:hypothetical protein